MTWKGSIAAQARVMGALAFPNEPGLVDGRLRLLEVTSITPFLE
jgi:hypothetical protein